MRQLSFEQWEAQIEEIAQAFPYPPTPDIAGTVARGGRRSSPARRTAVFSKRFAWAAVILLVVLLTGLMFIPQVQAALVEFLQLGAVRIFLAEPTPTSTPTATLPLPTASPSAVPTVTPRPSPTPIASVLDLAGQTTLAEAQAQVDFPIRLPTEPADLGPPDAVFLQDFGGPLLVLVWFEPDQPGQVRLSLHQLGPNTFAGKGAPAVIQETTVNGERALWMEGPHFFEMSNGQYAMRRLVEGKVLLWTEGEITYRLETKLPLDEARKIAESLQ
jgi:hypothetical protein